MGPVLVVEHGAVVHSAFVGLGVLAATGMFFAEVRRRQAYDERLLVVVAGALVGGAVGMRAAGLVHYLDAAGTSALADAWRFGAKSILGGLAGAYAGALLGKRLAGYPTPTGDLFAPAVALGMAVGRWGCFLTEPVGRPTGLPWAVRGMHPSFGYEIAFHAAAFAGLLWLRPRVDAPGALLVVYLAAYAAFRFLVEFTRANEVVAWGLTGSQWFVLAVAPLLAVKLSRTAWRAPAVGVSS